MLSENCLVAFKKLNNARGYRLTGRVVEINNQMAVVESFGLYGPGSDTNIHNVPLDELEELPPMGDERF